MIGRYFREGFKDGYEGTFNPPHGSWTVDRQSLEENAAYEYGYFYGRGQSEARKGDYDPPTSSGYREAYDAGYNSELGDEDDLVTSLFG